MAAPARAGSGRAPAAPAPVREAATPPAAERLPLFRQAAVDAQRSQWLGTVGLASPVSQRVIGAVCLGLLALIVAFVSLAEFARRARVTGWLVPDVGLVRVHAPANGVVSAVLVEEGRQVRRGDPLVVLTSERRSALGDANAETTRRIEERIRLLGEQRSRQQSLFDQQARALRERIRRLREENAQIDDEVRVQRERVRLLEESAARLKALGESGYASTQMILAQRDTLLENVARVRAMERSGTSNRREIAAAEAELESLPVTRDSQASALEREVSELEQQRAQAAATSEMVLTAPQDGVVTAVQADVGAAAGTAAPVVTILPSRAKLQGHLFSPSRSIGFVSVGQRVTMRYPAYPYQKYGHQLGSVRSISRNAIAPADMPPQLMGLASVLGGAEPVYRITVTLDAQAIDTGKAEYRLMPGMLLEADIELERRSILEWILEPVLSLTERT
jgi:membrane fusion protein